MVLYFQHWTFISPPDTSAAECHCTLAQPLRFCWYECVLSRSVVSDPIDCQAPLLIEFSRQEYWSKFSFPTQGDLPDPGIDPTFLVSPTFAGRFFTTVLDGKPHSYWS